MRDSLSAHLRGMEPDSDDTGADGESGLPPLGGGGYQAYGRQANKPLVSLHFIMPDGCVRSFQYRHLDSDTRFDHQKITLRFLGFRPTMIVIEGRNLRQLYDFIHQDRMPWVMQAARDFAEEGKPIVSKLTFVEMVEREG